MLLTATSRSRSEKNIVLALQCLHLLKKILPTYVKTNSRAKIVRQLAHVIDHDIRDVRKAAVVVRNAWYLMKESGNGEVRNV